MALATEQFLSCVCGLFQYALKGSYLGPGNTKSTGPLYGGYTPEPLSARHCFMIRVYGMHVGCRFSLNCRQQQKVNKYQTYNRFNS